MALKINILVKPNAKTNSFGLSEQSELWIKIKAPATEGKANEATLQYLAEILNCQKKEIELLDGHKSRNKTFLVPFKTKEEILNLFNSQSRD
jgi:uncharacterized protein (TIGR00251 family)